MKALVILILVIALVAGIWFYINSQASSPGTSVQVGFGIPTDGAIPMDIILTTAMSSIEEPDGDTRFGGAWQQWLDKHFELLDGSGKKVAIQYANSSDFIGGSHGSSDIGFLHVNLEPNGRYTLRYTPKVSEGTTYQGSITVPDQARAPAILTMTPQ
jgi:hypothetical protein